MGYTRFFHLLGLRFESWSDKSGNIGSCLQVLSEFSVKRILIN